MTEIDEIIYKILLWALPLLLGMLGFIGALMVRQLMKLSDSVNEIKITIAKIAAKHDDLEKRVDKLEEKTFA
jgi:hypothetical protein